MFSRKLSAFVAGKDGDPGCPEQAGDESLSHRHHAVKYLFTAGDETGKKLWDPSNFTLHSSHYINFHRTFASKKKENDSKRTDKPAP
jgi:hypothetical protein